MNRKEFLRKSALIGTGLPFLPSLLSSCSEEVFSRMFPVNFDGKVLIIGAGAAGITAGYVLHQHGVDFEILEASSVFGGRVKKTESFVDFPIDLGAEWIHTDPSIFAQLINDPEHNGQIDLINYSPETIHVWKNDALRKRNFFSNFYAEYKFKTTTWYDFFDQYMIPSIGDRVVFDAPISNIDYSEGVQVFDESGRSYEGDKIILTVPLTSLKQGTIEFSPPLPSAKQSALQDVDMPDGIKVFMKFSERFYPDLTFDGNLISNAFGSEDGEKIYYDAAFRKDTPANVLGLFSAGENASVYANQPDDDAVMNYVMDELDMYFDGKASRYYESHIVQNWSKEKYIGGSYSHYDSYDSREALVAPIDNKVFFAGETYAPESDIATVHGAALSAYNAVEAVLAG